MSLPKASGRKSVLGQFASTYLKSRWYLGAGLIVLTVVVLVAGTDGSYAWVVAAAGVVVLAHAFAMRAWDMRDATVALVVDVTVALLATMYIATATDEHSPALLAFVGAAVLIALFTQGWPRVLIAIGAAGMTLLTLLFIHDMDPVLAFGDFIGAFFVAGLIMGVVAAIRGRLVELEAARAQTIGVVSHELRNHLTGVIGAAELIRDENTRLAPEEVDELLDLAYHQAVEAGEVIEDLLIASRAERGVLDALPEVIDLCPVTETVIRRTSVETGDIRYDFSGGPVWAFADPLRYKQIVRNLLTNALRYGGDAILVSVEPIGDRVSVVVADNGEGVDPTHESSMFLPYHGGKTVRHVSDSSGLGLWIARSLAQKMTGDLTYRRESGQSVFELTLPGADGNEPTEHDMSGSAQARA